VYPVGRCPRCGYVLRYDGYKLKCDFCGYLQPRTTLSRTIRDAERALRLKFNSLIENLARPRGQPNALYYVSPLRFQRPCRVCGTNLPLGARNCPNCGTLLAETPVVQQADSGLQVRDQRVMDYITSHDGTISLSKASEELSMSVDALKLSIDRLKATGFIEQT